MNAPLRAGSVTIFPRLLCQPKWAQEGLSQPSAALLLVCIQDTGNKVAYLTLALEEGKPLLRLADSQCQYTFVEQATGHQTVTHFRRIAVTNPTSA